MNLPKPNLKDPKHLLIIGAGLLVLYAMKTLLVLAAIGLFIASATISAKKQQEMKPNPGKS